MTTTTHFTRKKLRAGSALQALALLGAGLTISAALAAPAAAQDYTSGAITGTVTDETGNPVSDATVTITSVSQGTTRTVTTGDSGSFRVSALPAGSYDVAVTASGMPGYRADGVSILASQTAQINVELSSSQEIVVTGSRAVAAFTGTTTGLNVDVADFIKSKPLGRDLTSVVLLAPNTTAGDTSFGNLPSIGGSSVAENAYYINGLNTTNFDNYLGSATVPFYFYKSVEVKNGGYPAEYGRATGGIVNAVTKSGSNDFFAAVHIDWGPNFLRSKGKDLLTYDSDTDSYVRSTNRHADRDDTLLTAIEVGGPIIKDRLFAYGLLQLQHNTSLDNFPHSGTAYRYKENSPFWGVKLDAYPIDSQHLEFTIYDTRNTQTQSTIAGYSYVNGVNAYPTASSVQENYGGGVNFVGKYTGHMTDWLTLSAAYGRVRDRFDFVYTAGEGNLPYFANASGQTIGDVADGQFFTSQRTQLFDGAYNTERKFLRADADLFVSLLGDHHIRFGYDQEKNTLNHSTVTTGGVLEHDNGFLSDAAFNALAGNGGVRMIARAPDAAGDIVELNYYNTGGAFKAKNQAYYIEDEWKPFDRLTLNLGVRRDDFRVNKPGGAPIAALKKNYAPRLGAEYALWGDKSGRVYGSYGWYYLPVASNTAYRQGAPSYYFRQRWHFDGVDANGLPNLTTLVTDQGTYQSTCPFELLPGGPTTNCNVTGDGADVNTTQAIASNLKATRESEWIVGYEQTFGDWTLGINYTHRNLDRTAEDSSIDAAVNAWCADNNVVAHETGTGTAIPCTDIWTGYHQYVINNPGQDITVDLLAAGTDLDFQTVTFTADQLGYGKAKRTYDAVTFTFDRAWDGNWSLGGSYTWSKSKGNSEGYVQSDFAQSDSGITQDFDQPGFVDYAYGYLPNDRRHLFKLYGTVALSDAFTLGSSVQVTSARPLSCFGWHPTDAFAGGYGAASHFCGGEPSPRGTAQKTDWVETINLAARYNLNIADHTVTLRADVFNLLNSQSITSRYEFGDLDVVTDPNTGLPSSYIPDPDYHLPTGYQSPRYVRLGLDIEF
ncbi:MAG TPA: TonB-dependent receptor [Sphingomonas sp.]|nr:TonB-dependent receptor [Sphingomonas sp.]